MSNTEPGGPKKVSEFPVENGEENIVKPLDNGYVPDPDPDAVARLQARTYRRLEAPGSNVSVIREALAILDARELDADFDRNSGLHHRGLRLTLGYALADHEDGRCPAADGECVAAQTARQIVAGEL